MEVEKDDPTILVLEVPAGLAILPLLVDGEETSQQ